MKGISFTNTFVSFATKTGVAVVSGRIEMSATDALSAAPLFRAFDAELFVEATIITGGGPGDERGLTLGSIRVIATVRIGFGSAAGESLDAEQTMHNPGKDATAAVVALAKVGGRGSG